MVKRIIRGGLSCLLFSIFGLGALFIGFILLPVLALICHNKDTRKYLSVFVIKYSWVFFIFLMKFSRLISVNVDRHYLKQCKGTIIVANHPSLIDVVILVSLVPKPVCVIKSTIGNNFFMKHVVFNAYIKNNTGADCFIAECSDVLAKGYNLIIFPEGTRSLPDVKAKLQRGAAYVALHTHAPLLPVHIQQSEWVLGKHQQFFNVSEKVVTYTLTVKPLVNVVDIKKNAHTSALCARRITAKIQEDIGITL